MKKVNELYINLDPRFEFCDKIKCDVYTFENNNFILYDANKGEETRILSKAL